MLRTLTTLAFQNALALPHRRWRPRREAAREGYSILLPVPADLPLFYRLAMATLSRQTLRGANEILVLPDANIDAFRSLVAAGTPFELPLPVRCISSHPWRDALRRAVGRPHYNHFTQIVRGIDHATSQYLVLHDADLFLTEPDFLDRQHEIAAAGRLSLLGVDGAKDDWYRRNGFAHVAATWELVFRSDWARRFQPSELRSGTRSLGGRLGGHDTMLFAQCRTAPDEIEWQTVEHGFVHFNYVICTYRDFLKVRRRFEDERFIIPLLRLLIDGFDPDGPYPEIPAWSDILRCLDGGSDRILFPKPGADRGKYAELRDRLNALCRSGFVPPDRAAVMEDRLRAFDRIYAPGRFERVAAPAIEAAA
ncbi:hypothetical protein [Antarcticirhabdus aurantiaca]|uniref:Uncharacterized protein n=1 Tax=Antarcticirhabdus aurantiaca TaxID=2606717 RepID=A0ACD4NMD7_9HYPH|nr:hypothetical protein [Antarcticirhabdus aurantiaca]WAJ27958.1 hypothetical protein OXU80_24500 [Jeongeuplla avenae]